MKILLSSMFLLFSFSFSIYASVDFSVYIPASTIDLTTLTPGTPESELLIEYDKMRDDIDFEELERRAGEFDSLIYDPVGLNHNPNQDQYIKTLEDLNKNLSETHVIIRSFFKNSKARIENRLDLARLEQQRFYNLATRGNFSHPEISINSYLPLNSVIGKIFHITKKRGKSKEVDNIGSGMMINIDFGKPGTIRPGTILNGVMTCAHVIEAREYEHLIGVYFVANQYLHPETGLPILNSVKDSKSLIHYLKTNPESFEFDSYNLKRRIARISAIRAGNDIYTTKPQYWDNEDIAFGKFKSASYQYSHNVKINFDLITKDNPSLAFHKKSKPYFVAGYPGCSHYSRKAFKKDYNSGLINTLGLSPLFLTSAPITFNARGKLESPTFKDGRIFHKAPTAKGMSGGPIFRAHNDKRITVLGCVTTGVNQDEEGCY